MSLTRARPAGSKAWVRALGLGLAKPRTVVMPWGRGRGEAEDPVPPPLQGLGSGAVAWCRKWRHRLGGGEEGDKGWGGVEVPAGGG